MSRLKRRDDDEVVEETTEEQTMSEQLDDYVDDDDSWMKIPIDVNKTISTGSTLLDLNILGGRVKGGGLPGGIMVEISGTSASGKTALLMECVASVQAKGGDARICDPEGRLDREYAQSNGATIPDDIYFRPNIVLDKVSDRGKIIEKGIQSLFWDWEPENKDVINIFGADSIAALSTSMEMDTRDKMGMRKAKELSEFCRKSARNIALEHKLVIFTNQLRDGSPTPTGLPTKTTTGGHAVPYYSTVRISCKQIAQISRTLTNSNGVKVPKKIGIQSQLEVFKNSLDDPYRKCDMHLLFGYGISDILSNLEYTKEMTGRSSGYDCIGKIVKSKWDAIDYIEDNDLEEELREWVIELWEENEQLFKKRKRKPKKRF